MEQPFAVITGASTPIGLELAKQFGLNGYELLIVSGSDDIFTTQQKLEETGIVVEAMKANLASYAGVENLYVRIQKFGRPLDIIAINASVGSGGEFTETDLREEINLINLNIVSTIHLVKRILPDMRDREAGRILFTSVMPSPYEAVYDASISFINSFAESIKNEMKNHDVKVTILTPEAGSESKFENDMPEVAKLGFEALMAGKERVFSESLLTRLQGVAMKLLPEKAKTDFSRSTHH